MLVIWKLGFWISLLFTCRATDTEVSNKIIDSVEFQESRGEYFVKSNGSCTGLMQVNYHYTAIPRPLLKIPVINRVVGARALRDWKRKSRNMKYALAAYNCGYRGLDGRCGIGYANTVLGRNIYHYRIPACSLFGRSINFYIDNEQRIKKGLTRFKTSFIIHHTNSNKHKRR